ncbi:MAG TPA: phosphatase domain-containing protein [Rubrobacteraceae bacterium]|nr:phosphatase domain-containing protein [Rubrobacteraceae bacterium]
MYDWRKRLLAALEWVDPRIDRLRLHLKLRRGRLGKVGIVPYSGYGTGQRLRLKGRVLEERKVRLPAENDPAWRNFRAMVRRFLSAEVPGARVRTRFGGRDRVFVADDEGFVDVFLEPQETLPEDQSWHPVELELLWPKAAGQKESRTTGSVLVPPTSAEFAVISDIDDTIVRSEATNLLRMLRLTLFSNAYTRLPFEGVAAFYRTLHGGGNSEAANPIFYVSTGPWNLYDLLEDFLQLQDIPAGPLFLKDWGGLKDVLRGMNHREHKLEVIRGIMNDYPDLPFVLIGDSGQEDAETYGQISREYPGRVRAIYIRDVQNKRRSQTVCDIADEMQYFSIPMLLVDDTVEAARHAAKLGLIPDASLPEILRDREEDADGSGTLAGVVGISEER